MIIELTLGLAAGFAVGWLAQSAKRSTKTRVLEELFSRKLKLAESDREQALRTSDESKRQFAGLEERISAQDAETERLLSELEVSIAQRRAAEVELALRADALAAARDDLLRARSFADEALLESSQAAREREEIAAAGETLRVQLAAHEIESEQLATRVRERGGEVDDLRGELMRRAAELDELRAAQDVAEREAAELRANFESTRAEQMRLQPFEAALADRQRVLATREVEIATLASRVTELEADSRATFETTRAELMRLHPFEGALADCQRVLATREAKIATLASHVAKLEAESRATFESTQAELMRLQPFEAALADTQRVLATREAKIATLASHVAKLEAKTEHLRETELALAAAREESKRQATTIARLERNLETTTERMRTVTAEQRLRIVELKAQAKSAKHNVLARDSTARDDFQRIAGIGPVLAKKLHRVGVNTFRQLAELSGDEVERVAHSLGVPAARIRRERWITAARHELHAKTV